ncbi:MAG TPA: hypothetical protein VH701_24115 [Vicinamibacterales bacterium]
MSSMKHVSTTGISRVRKDRRTLDDPFKTVKTIAHTLPDVEATTRYDGSSVLKAGGAFMAGLATHPSAEPGTLVVKVNLEDREGFLEDAPEIYYLTEYYRNYPVVLVRLSRIDRNALRDLLAASRVLALAKGRQRRRAKYS